MLATMKGGVLMIWVVRNVPKTICYYQFVLFIENHSFFLPIHVFVRQICPIDQSIWMREIQIIPQGQGGTRQVKHVQRFNISQFLANILD